MITTQPKLFVIGQQVTMTEKALAQQLDGPRHLRTGIITNVIRISDRQQYLTIRRYGMKRKELYHFDFWEVTGQPQAIADTTRRCHACGQTLP